jgi:hypothetical protein
MYFLLYAVRYWHLHQRNHQKELAVDTKESNSLNTRSPGFEPRHTYPLTCSTLVTSVVERGYLPFPAFLRASSGTSSTPPRTCALESVLELIAPHVGQSRRLACSALFLVSTIEAACLCYFSLLRFDLVTGTAWQICFLFHCFLGLNSGLQRLKSWLPLPE